MNAEQSVSDYIEGVKNGSIPCCKYVRMAVARHERCIRDAESLGLFFDWPSVQTVIDFFGILKHSKGRWASKKFRLEPWQAFILAEIFGWKRSSDGLRRYRTAYVEVPRKNGKTTFAAGIALYCLTLDGESGAEVYSAATKRDQAKICFDEARRMVLASELKNVLTAKLQNIHCLATHSKFEPLGADADTLDGLNPHCIIIDELHAHKSRDLWDVLETATGSRSQPLTFAITTAGVNRPCVCLEIRNYCIGVIDPESGVNDETTFAFISSIDDGDDWKTVEARKKANPNYGVSVLVDDIERMAEKAASSVADENAFRNKRLNEWTEQAIRWLTLESWDACADTIDPESLAGCECYAGLDLSKTTDISALVLVFPQGEKYTVLPWFWCPEDCAKDRDTRNRTNYLQWARAGHIELTSGNVIDYGFIRKRINELSKKYNLIDVGYDPYNASHLAQELQEEDGIVMVEMRQGALTLNEPSKELERKILSGLMRHNGNPVLRWMAGNVSISFDANENIKPDKKKSSEKIDGIVATILGIGRAMSAAGGSFDGKLLVV
jgi:phage terminase large subunit-like protein